MNTRLYTRSWGGGEVGPLLYGRVDTQSYQTGAQRVRNFLVRPQGALERRPGFQYVGTAKNSAQRVIVRPFIYSTDQTLVLEFGENTSDPSTVGRAKGYIRFFQNGAAVTFSAPSAWSSASVAYELGDLVSYLGTNYYCMFAHTSTGLLTPTASVQYWYALTGTTLEVPTPYDADDLLELRMFQSNDVLTILHESYAPRELRRYGATDWVLSDINFFGTALASPTGLAGVATWGQGWRAITCTGRNPLTLTFTADHGFLDNDTVYMRGTSTVTAELTGISDGFYSVHTDSTTPTQVIVADFDTGEQIVATTPGGGSATPFSFTAGEDLIINPSLLGKDTGNTYCVTAIDDDGVETRQSDEASVTNNLFVPGSYNTLSWNLVTGAVRYRVYKKQNGLFGYIGEVTHPTFTFKDENIGPDMSITPPIPDRTMGERMQMASVDTGTERINFGAPHPFSQNEQVVLELGDVSSSLPTGLTASTVVYYVDVVDSDTIRLLTSSGTLVSFSGSLTGTCYVRSIQDWPRAGCYFEGRRVFAGSANEPQSVWMTSSGTESDLSYHIPTRDSDRIKFTIAAREATTIRHCLPMGHLVLLSNSAEFRVTPLNSDALTPGSISVRPQSYVGANNVAPLVVNNQAVYCAARGGHVREMGWNSNYEGFVTGDLSLRAAHLFDGKDLLDAAQAKSKWPVLWFVNDDGLLLGLTYVPEEKVGAWHWHDTDDDDFESCCTVPEGENDVLYVVTNRGSTRYIERMLPDGVANYPLRLDCATVQTGTSTTVTGLSRFNGQTVQVVIDGIRRDDKTVSGGQITGISPTPATEVHVGLGYESDLVTLPVTAEIEALAQGRTKNVSNLWLKVEDAYFFRVAHGTTEPTYDAWADTLESYSATDADVQVLVPQNWSNGGQLWVRCDEPYPLTILGMTLEVSIGG